jgi:hypothetical protein
MTGRLPDVQKEARRFAFVAVSAAASETSEPYDAYSAAATPSVEIQSI